MSVRKVNRYRPLTSGVWNFFTPDPDIDSQYATCNICKQKFSYKTSTSNLRRHMTSRHPTIMISAISTTAKMSAVNENPHTIDPDEPAAITNIQLFEGSSNINSPLSSVPPTSVATSSSSLSNNLPSARPLHQSTMTGYVQKKMTSNMAKNINNKLLMLIIKDYQPFKIVEDKAFVEFVAALNPAYELPSRHSISKSLIPALYEECLIRTKSLISKSPKVCLTTDCWTSVNTQSFIAITSHFIDENFNLISILMKCAEMPVQHTSVNLAKELRNTASEWGIEDKIVITVSDNAANIKCAILQHLVWEHLGCLPHKINLIVKEGLLHPPIQKILQNICTIVSYFRRSCKANEKLITYQKNTTTRQPLKLLQDVSTRWNSTYFMLERFALLQESIKATTALLDKYLPTISTEDWKIVRELTEVLKPFETVSREMSGEKFATASMVIPISIGLKNVCNALLNKPLNEDVQHVIQCLKSSICERLSNAEENSTLLVCTFLDPRFKMLAFSNQEIAKTAKSKVSELVAKKIINIDSIQESSEPVNMEEDNELSVWNTLDVSIATNQPEKATSTSSKANAEVDRYIGEDYLRRHEDPLNWWRHHQYNYPNLSAVVRDMFCALGSSVPCERVFSKAGVMLTDRRNRLSSNKVKMLMFLNCNMGNIV